MESVKKGLDQNLSQNADYSRARSKLGNDGQALVVFVAKDSARTLLESVTLKNISTELAEVIKSGVNKQLYEFIVKKGEFLWQKTNIYLKNSKFYTKK
jgi:hypothetical protein